MNEIINQYINNLDTIIYNINNTTISYNDFFNYYYFSVHTYVQNMCGINELKNSLIHATVQCKNEKELRSVNIIKNALIDSLGKQR